MRRLCYEYAASRISILVGHVLRLWFLTTLLLSGLVSCGGQVQALSSVNLK